MKLLSYVLLYLLFFCGTSFAVPAGKFLEFGGGIVFDGKIHADKGLKCVDCHTKIFKMKKGSTSNITEKCDQCHRGSGLSNKPQISNYTSSKSKIVYEKQGTVRINIVPAPPYLSASIEFSEPSGNNILDADDIGKLIITVKNSGKGHVFDVAGEISASKRLSGMSFANNISFGTISAGSSARKEVEMRASEEVRTDSVSFDVEIKEANGFDSNPLKISFKTKAFEPPKIIIADIGIEDQNKNYKVEPMEIVEITARVQNIGYGDAQEVAADIKIGDNVFIAAGSQTHFELGSIKGGQFKDVKFMFYTNNRIKNGQTIPITLEVKERRPKFAISNPLTLVMDAPQKRIEEIIVKGDETGGKPDIQVASGLSIDVDTNIPESVKGEKLGKYDVAVIIGNKNYAASGLPDVDFADRDARILREYLLKTFGYDRENIIYVENATYAKMNEFFGSEKDHRGKLYKYVKEGVSRVFIYYVGHGAPDLETKEAYFVPVDADPHYLNSGGYRLQTFYNNISQLPAKNVTIVIDACFSGNSDKGMLFKNISPALIKVKKEFQSPDNAVLFTSAGMDQVSSWYPAKKHSLFTYYFLKGIQGEADVDKNGKVTAGEMRDYLKENVSYEARKMGNEQNPVMMGKDQDVIVVLKR